MGTQEELTAAEAQETAAMEAVFSTTDQEPVDDQPIQEEPVKVEEPEVLQPQVVALTVEALRDSIEEQTRVAQQAHAKLSGKVGELQQRIDSIRQAGGISPKAREKLTTEFPELAEMLFGDEPIPAQLPAAKAADIDISSVVNSKLDETTKNFEKRLLKRDHPDWQDLVKTEAFGHWRANVLSPEDDATLADAWDADFISEKLTEFKSWKQQQAENAGKESARAAGKNAEKDAKRDRLEAAILPDGTPRGLQGGAPGVDEEEAAMLAAYGKRHRL
jgi:hypothetical protein